MIKWRIGLPAVKKFRRDLRKIDSGREELKQLLLLVNNPGLTLNFPRGLIVTTAKFTRAAKSEASLTNRIKLIGYNNSGDTIRNSAASQEKINNN